MKKLLVLLLVFAMCVSICTFAVSCSDNGGGSSEIPDDSEGGEFPDGSEGGESPDGDEGGESPDDSEEIEDEDGPPILDWVPID